MADGTGRERSRGPIARIRLSDDRIDPALSAYLKPAVKIEFGARFDHEPAEVKLGRPYLADALRAVTVNFPRLLR